MKPAPTQWRTVSLIGGVALIIASFYLVMNLVAVSFDTAGLVQFGEAEPDRVEYAEQQFGRDIPLATELGHDGRFFFIQASDPWLLSPREHAIQLGRPLYRSQRMFYPALASLGGLLGSDGIVVGMIATQVVFYVVGTVATASLATSLGLSPWWGLGFAFNPGVRFELEILGAGVLGLALLILSMDAYLRGHPGLSVLFGSMTVLTREVLWIALAGVALVTFKRRPRHALLLALGPLSVAALWAVYLRLRIGDLPSEPTIQELGLPFRGIWATVRVWSMNGASTSDVALAVLSLILVIAVLASALRSRSPLLWGCVGFALLAPLLSSQVWLNGFDISRALSPMFTLFALHLAVRLFSSQSASNCVASR